MVCAPPELSPLNTVLAVNSQLGSHLLTGLLEEPEQRPPLPLVKNTPQHAGLYHKSYIILHLLPSTITLQSTTTLRWPSGPPGSGKVCIPL